MVYFFGTLYLGFNITLGSNMNQDPLHGVKLEDILTKLEKKIGWKTMGELLNINCFTNDPRLKSSLKFLRKTPWARKKVEILYLKTFCKDNPATTMLIRNFIEQKKNNGAPAAKKENGFSWPTLKSK
jgi:uncharacterized protein (DUF2132 family)